MSVRIKIAFTDFWEPFVPENNFYFDLFKDIYGEAEVTSPEDADVLFYGPYGKQHNNYDPSSKIKIFVTGENVRPNFDECTYSLTFDFEDHGGRNIRLPLWFIHLDWYNKGGYINPEFIMPLDKIDDNEYTQTPKTKFCVLVSNNLFDNRVECINKLRSYKPVDCYGKPFGNGWQNLLDTKARLGGSMSSSDMDQFIGYGESKKYELYSRYKFSVCFENSFAPTGGYYTEKLIHSKLAGTIPLYYADSKVGEDFNTESFLNLNDYDSMDDLVHHVIEIDKDDAKYERIRSAPLFKKNPDHTDLEKLKTRIKEMVKL